MEAKKYFEPGKDVYIVHLGNSNEPYYITAKNC